MSFIIGKVRAMGGHRGGKRQAEIHRKDGQPEEEERGTRPGFP